MAEDTRLINALDNNNNNIVLLPSQPRQITERKHLHVAEEREKVSNELFTRGKGKQEEVQRGRVACFRSDHDHQPPVDRGQTTANDEPCNYSSRTAAPYISLPTAVLSVTHTHTKSIQINVTNLCICLQNSLTQAIVPILCLIFCCVTV